LNGLLTPRSMEDRTITSRTSISSLVNEASDLRYAASASRQSLSPPHRPHPYRSDSRDGQSRHYASIDPRPSTQSAHPRHAVMDTRPYHYDIADSRQHTVLPTADHRRTSYTAPPQQYLAEPRRPSHPPFSAESFHHLPTHLPVRPVQARQYSDPTHLAAPSHTQAPGPGFTSVAPACRYAHEEPDKGTGGRTSIYRTTQACERCRIRKVRCDSGGKLRKGGELSPCSRCVAGRHSCVYGDGQRKRGPIAGSLPKSPRSSKYKQRNQALPDDECMDGPREVGRQLSIPRIQDRRSSGRSTESGGSTRSSQTSQSTRVITPDDSRRLSYGFQQPILAPQPVMAFHQSTFHPRNDDHGRKTDTGSGSGYFSPNYSLQTRQADAQPDWSRQHSNSLPQPRILENGKRKEPERKISNFGRDGRDLPPLAELGVKPSFTH
jgi:hypothetical protein